MRKSINVVAQCLGLLPVSFGVQSGMAPWTFGGHVMPHLVLEGCKTNSFMKGAVLQLE